jgi:microcystin-dependent protein
LCDGTNGTPDLRDRFVVGAGSTYAVNATGGVNTVTLAEAQLPAHTHSFSATTTAAGSHSHTTGSAGNHAHNFFHGARNVGGSTPGGYGDSFFGSPISAPDAGGVTETRTRGDMVQAAGAHTHTVSTAPDHTHTVSGFTGNVGGTAAHENRPPYLALAYIMRA